MNAQENYGEVIEALQSVDAVIATLTKKRRSVGERAELVSCLQCARGHLVAALAHAKQIILDADDARRRRQP